MKTSLMRAAVLAGGVLLAVGVPAARSAPVPHATVKPAVHHVKPAHVKPAHIRSGEAAEERGEKANGTHAVAAMSPRLRDRIQALLPSDLSVEEAADGFRNRGQFIAAVNVSHNLDIPFTTLKDTMLQPGMSLGRAIHRLKPGADLDDALAQARRDAKLEEAGRPSLGPTSGSARSMTRTSVGFFSARHAAKLESMLPAGADFEEAAEGFASRQQFVSTVFAAHDLGLSFQSLKDLEVKQELSLSQALRQLKPGIDADDIVLAIHNQMAKDLDEGREAQRRHSR